jgi:hypothetical protein
VQEYDVAGLFGLEAVRERGVVDEVAEVVAGIGGDAEVGVFLRGGFRLGISVRS